MAMGMRGFSADRGRSLFPAVYEGYCADCGADIDPGDPIGYMQGYSSPVCEECFEIA